jgi:SAM-dependent methyltransferase
MKQPWLETNRALWDDLVEINAASDFYDLDGFRSGRSSLRPIEVRELGPVTGRSLLHLHCHFGMDTLSWARAGARVTGVDFSPRAIERARALAEEVGVPARFVCSSTYDLPQVLDDRFDVVFLSYGVLIWLPDVERLARLVARYLVPGGTFYMVEFHPILGTFGDAGEPLRASYFHESAARRYEEAGTYAEPDDPVVRRYEEAGTYAEPDDPVVRASYEWQHPVSDVVSALCAAGLRIEFLHEFPESPWRVPLLEEIAPGHSVLRGHPNTIPLVYSIRARRAR